MNQRDEKRIRRNLLLQMADCGDYDGTQRLTREMEEESKHKEQRESLKFIRSHYKQVPVSVICDVLDINLNQYKNIVRANNLASTDFYYCKQEDMYGSVYQFAEYWRIDIEQARRILNKKGEKVQTRFHLVCNLIEKSKGVNV